MSIDQLTALESLLVRAQALHQDMVSSEAGMAVLHMDAAVAALESQLRRAKPAPAKGSVTA